MSLKVVAHKNAAEDVSIGVEDEGVFVPFFTFSRAKYAQHVERYNTLQQRAEEGDGLAQDVLGTAYTEPKKSSASKSKSEGGES